MAIFGFNNKNNNLEVLNEVKIVSNNELSIYVEGEGRVGHNWYKDPYFKVFHGSSKQKAKYVSRISFSEPKYLFHKSEEGVPAKLDRTQLKLLLKMLTPDVWKEMNKIRVDLSKQITNEPIPDMYHMPDYSKLNQ